MNEKDKTYPDEGFSLHDAFVAIANGDGGKVRSRFLDELRRMARGIGKFQQSDQEEAVEHLMLVICRDQIAYCGDSEGQARTWARRVLQNYLFEKARTGSRRDRLRSGREVEIIRNTAGLDDNVVWVEWRGDGVRRSMDAVSETSGEKERESEAREARRQFLTNLYDKFLAVSGRKRKSLRDLIQTWFQEMPWEQSAAQLGFTDDRDAYDQRMHRARQYFFDIFHTLCEKGELNALERKAAGIMVSGFVGVVCPWCGTLIKKRTGDRCCSYNEEMGEDEQV